MQCVRRFNWCAKILCQFLFYFLLGQNKQKILAHSVRVQILLQDVIREMSTKVELQPYPSSLHMSDPMPGQSSSTPAYSRSAMKRMSSSASMSKLMLGNMRGDKDRENQREKDVGKLRSDWARRMQLRFCADWAARNSFGMRSFSSLSGSL